MKSRFCKKCAYMAMVYTLLTAPIFGGIQSRLFTKEGTIVDPAFFPIAVWLQDPRNAERFQAAGINLYVGLWNGPTRSQLDLLEKAGMPVICDPNEFALQNLGNATFAAWMHGDEPDNAQLLPDGKGYGPPIPPEKIIRDYQRVRSSDPSRPVLLNLSQGVAWDNWFGRGERTNHPEDYAEYAKGGDIISFDIYPAVHTASEVAGKLEFVAKGVQRLTAWTGGAKPVWACIECSRIDNPNIKPTPEQIRSEVWMAIIQGARGLIYFTHQFQPEFKEAALLDDPPMLAAVTTINAQIRDLAPVLNSPSVNEGLAVQPSDGSLAVLMKRHDGAEWIFAVNLTDRPMRGDFRVSKNEGQRIEVLGESRDVAWKGQIFSDEFAPYAVHLYRLGAVSGPP